MRSWFRLVERCPRCGLYLDRQEPGYQVGSYMFNLIVAELVFAAVILLVLRITWPSPPWTLLTWGGATLMVLAPLVFFPFSKTLFLAFDLLFRPRQENQATPDG